MAAGESPKRRKDGTPVDQPLPPRGVTRTRPPFEPGNSLALKHGAFSPRAVAQRAAQVRELLQEVAPDLAQPIFEDAIMRYCEAEARSRMLAEHIAAVVDAEGVPSVPPYLWEQASKATTVAAKIGADCGLDAAGLARISRDLGFAKTTRRLLAQNDGPRLGEKGRALRLGRVRGRSEDDSRTTNEETQPPFKQQSEETSPDAS